MAAKQVILVAYDGSERSRTCLKYAFHVMNKERDSLECVLALRKEPGLAIPEVDDVPDVTSWTVPVETQEIAIRLEEELMKIFDSEGVKNAMVHLLPTVDVGETIAEHANKIHATLVVTGTRGLSTFQKILAGSTSDGLLHSANCPVLVVHNDDPLPHTTDNTRAKWMVAIDGGLESKFAFGKALDLAQPNDVFLLVKVVPDNTTDECGEDMEPFRKELDDKQIASVSLVLEGDDPAAAVCECVDERKPDFLVLGSRGIGSVRRFFFGSVSDECVKNAHCPVLVVKKPEQVQI